MNLAVALDIPKVLGYMLKTTTFWRLGMSLSSVSGKEKRRAYFGGSLRSSSHHWTRSVYGSHWGRNPFSPWLNLMMETSSFQNVAVFNK
jgi:hypothetical protein